MLRSVISVISVIVVAALCQGASAAVGEDVTNQFDIPDGYELRVWAESPQLFNPTNIDTDARGRIFATEAVNYRETLHPLHALKHPEGDRVVILEDTDGDGSADSSKVFAQDKDLVAPLGVGVIGDKVIVSCSPNVFVFTDTDGDDRADKKETFLTGFGGFDNDHGVHAVTGFLDGRWYFNTGNEGPHEVTDAGGWRLSSGSFYAIRGKNTGNRKSADGRVWTGGLALRIDADGKNLRPIAHNFRNCYELALDSFGNVFQTDNDDDGNQACRAAWRMEGGNYGYGSADGTRSWKTDRRPGQTTQPAHWHQDDPGVLPSGDITGAGGPTGVVVYEGGLLPGQYVGSMLSCDAGRNVIRAHKPLADGAGFRMERSDLVKPKDTSKEPGKWFRPSDVMVGSDGAVYIADWFDPMVGGHDMHDKGGRGRILRLAPRGDKTKPPKIDLASLEGQREALNSPAVNVRHVAAGKLRGRAEAELGPLPSEPRRLARLVWVMPSPENFLEKGDENVRIAAFRAVARRGGADVPLFAAKLADDPSPAIRREVLVALRDVPFEQCKDLLVKLAARYDGRDRFYLEALGLACDGKEDAVFAMLVRAFGSADPRSWSPAFANVAWRLHPKSAVDAFATRAATSTLTPEARERSADALAFIRDARSADAMERLASAGPDDVRAIAAWWLKQRAENDWKDFPAAQRHAKPDAERDARLAKRNADAAIVMDASKPMQQRERALGRLARDADGGKLLVALATDGKIPDDIKPAVAGPIAYNPDLGVRALASQYFPRQGAGGATLPPVKELAAVKGDAERGHAVFRGAAAACVRCHTFNGEGKDVGPDLTAIRTKYARPELIDAILNPSANIAFGYQPWIVQTRDNNVYAGFIIGDGETVIVKESTGEQRSIPASQIKKRVKQELSVMPDNISAGLSAQDLADVAEYLLTAPTK